MTPLSRLALLPAAALTFALLAAPAAQAFTYENKASGDSAASGLAPGARPYVDPDEQLDAKKGFDSNGATSIGQGGVTLQFGHERSFDEKYNPNDLFNPLSR